MAVFESHTVSVSGEITVKDLEDLAKLARSAGATDRTKVRYHPASGHQRDEIPARLEVIIA